jgi:hypothetical protein
MRMADPPWMCCDAGILFKNSEVLECAGRANIVVLDNLIRNA